MVVPALPREDTTDLVAAAAEVVVVALVREWGRKGLGGIIVGVVLGLVSAFWSLLTLLFLVVVVCRVEKCVKMMKGIARKTLETPVAF